MAEYTGNQLHITGKYKSKSTERLSSGYRINRAADDAAGLSISEKMRWQIRVLDKGKQNIQNIQDGMSLIDTADGALQETHSVLQRVRELTIQAYNDTYTREDRDAIQTEIDNCLKEVNRIANDTMFNTKQILKGNPESVIQVTGAEVVDVKTMGTATVDLPSWMVGKVDTKMEVHPSYKQAQDTSGVMMEYDGINDSSKEYYGPANAAGTRGYTYKGGWSADISDNASAKIDFSGLAQKNSATDLYQALYELIGCKLAYPCGTCSTEINGIFISASEDSFTTLGYEQIATSENIKSLNLSTTEFTYNGKTYNGYFEAAQEVLDKYGSNYDNDANNDIAGENTEVKALAENIAKDLSDKAADKLSDSMKDHFDRVVNGDDDYSLIVYDYRDDDKIANKTAADAEVKTSAKIRYEMV